MNKRIGFEAYHGFGRENNPKVILKREGFDEKDVRTNGIQF